MKFEKFENIIKYCIDKVFRVRLEIYGYFDAEEFLKLEKEKLKLELYDIADNDARNEAIDYYNFVFRKNDNTIEDKVNFIGEFSNRNCLDEDLYLRLVLLFLFNNAEVLTDKKIINLNVNDLFIVDYNIAIFNQYLENNICNVKSVSSLKYIFYNDTFIKPYLINDIKDFLDKIETSSKYYFRGHSIINYRLLPGIYRKNDLSYNEYNIVKSAIAEYPGIFNNLMNIDVLSEIQHYGGKTRLLDFTENPLVALYFAACNNEQKAGEVIVLEREGTNNFGLKSKYSDSDTLAILSALSFIKPETMSDFLNKNFDCTDVKDTDFVKELEYIIKQEKTGFDKKFLEINTLTSCAVYIANKVHDRIIRQSGIFVVCGLNAKNEIEKFLNKSRKKEDFDSKSCKTTTLFIINNKKHILKQLMNYGIGKHYLFPEIEHYFDEQ